ncbi:MAG: glycosyltransferase family 39 protein [Candidatus Aenigmarchaeota archaeon]|nr:glycosyltransferase family 39 protein [Candidatus Aenigmarchaeota archaeon]
MKNKLFYFIILIAIILRLFFLITDYHEIWWDSGAYIGMGKYIFSGGSVGLWEDIRPVVWPVVLGFGWFVGFNPEVFGRVITFLFSIGCIILVHVISRRFFDERTALFASSIFAFSPVFFYLGFHTYTEIPSLFLLLLSFYFLTSGRYSVAGIFLGISTLTRFPMGIFIAPVLLYFFFKFKLQTLLVFLSSFLITLLPFFIFNYVMYGNFLASFTAGAFAIKQVLGCNVLRAMPWSAYLKWIVLSEHPIHLFAVLGILYSLFSKNKKAYFIITAAVIPLTYYSQMNCRDYRYLLSFLPFVAMLTGYGLNLFVLWSEHKINMMKRWIFPAVFVLILFSSLWQGLVYYTGNEITTIDVAAINYFSFLKSNDVDGELWTANPIVAAFSDKKYEKIYYPVYHEQQYLDFYKYLANSSQKIGAVFLDNCGGGIICHPDDRICRKQNDITIDFLSKNFMPAYNASKGNCWYKIFIK